MHFTLRWSCTTNTYIQNECDAGMKGGETVSKSLRFISSYEKWKMIRWIPQKVRANKHLGPLETIHCPCPLKDLNNKAILPAVWILSACWLRSSPQSLIIALVFISRPLSFLSSVCGFKYHPHVLLFCIYNSSLNMFLKSRVVCTTDYSTTVIEIQ